MRAAQACSRTPGTRLAAIVAGTTYALEVTRHAAGMVLKIDNVVKATITATVNFSTVAHRQSIGASKQDGTCQADATFAAPVIGDTIMAGPFYRITVHDTSEVTARTDGMVKVEVFVEYDELGDNNWAILPDAPNHFDVLIPATSYCGDQHQPALRYRHQAAQGDGGPDRGVRRSGCWRSSDADTAARLDDQLAEPQDRQQFLDGLGRDVWLTSSSWRSSPHPR